MMEVDTSIILVSERIRAFVDGPAWDVLQPGDVILSVNHVDVSDAGRDDVIKLIKYNTHTHVSVTYIITSSASSSAASSYSRGNRLTDRND